MDLSAFVWHYALSSAIPARCWDALQDDLEILRVDHDLSKCVCVCVCAAAVCFEAWTFFFRPERHSFESIVKYFEPLSYFKRSLLYNQ